MVTFNVRAVRGGGLLENLVIVADHTPSDGASNVALDTVITVTFNKAMDQTSTEAAFSIAPSVAGSLSWSDGDKTLTFTPSANLSPDEGYTVSIDSSAEDTAANKLDSNKNYIGGEPEDTYTFSFSSEYPTLIKLDQFSAVPQSGHIDITWTTLSEIDNAGFNLYRSKKANGLYSKLNSRIIEAEGGAT